jgi:hypothetical protein
MLGGGSTWSLSPGYVSGSNTAVGSWTNNPLCANTYPLQTTPAQNAAWLAQSIVDQSSGGAGQGAVPNFYYPHTAMSAWLCRSLQANTYNCAANNNNNSNFCPNNSSPQGQLFYENIGQNNAPPHYAVYAVDGCVNAEGVGGGTVPGYSPDPNQFGTTAIAEDMVGNPPLIQAWCKHPN